MKKAGLILIVTALVFFTAGCASSARTALLAQKDPIALVSMVSNEDINWEGEPPEDPRVAGPLTKKKLRSDSDLVIVTAADEIINIAEGIFRNTIAASAQISLADKDTVLNSRAYLEAKEKKYTKRDMVKPDNYRFVDYGDRKFLAALAAETGINRSMFIEFNLTKYMISGIGKFGNARTEVKMLVIILDAKGKTIYRKEHIAVGDSTMHVSNGIYSQMELTELFRESITEACYDFLEQL